MHAPHAERAKASMEHCNYKHGQFSENTENRENAIICSQKSISKTKSHISRTSQNVFDVKTHSRWDVFEMGDKIFSLKSIILECHEDREW